MKKIFAYKRIYILILLPISFILIILAKKSSYFAEQIYAKHIYKWISQIISTITGLLPFSIAEILVITVPIAILIILLRFIIKMIVVKSNRKERLVKGILNVLCTGSIALFTFTLCGGLNYYRSSFGTYSNLEIQESSVQELYALTESLALQANDFREQIPQTDESGVFQLSMSNYQLAKIAEKAYDNLAEDYPILSGSYGAPKPVLLSELMSSTEITGIFFPFTMEANVNVDIPDYTVPATMLHEMAHQRGFMREDEANYLAYLAGMASDNVELQYSSTMLALVTAGNALYDQDSDLYFEIRDMYSDGVLMDIVANSDYWQKYEDTVVSTVSNSINDTYLKANAQTDGVKSYGRMLDLLLAQYRMDNETE
ncbi:MAG TPA: DUF3810 domain-containing protein [Mobilitalea sp.]|nr:DUF3810 domain-containing protein [Mobilitalea sp.]